MNEKLKLLSPVEQKVPVQKLSNWVRWPLRVLAYPIMMTDLLAQSLVQKIYKTQYVLEGSCKKRGACCQFIHMGWPKKGRISLFAKIYLFWQTEVLGFYFKSFDFVEDGEITKVMGCRYLKGDGSCKHYFLRPAICRNWPKMHYMREPNLLKGCGYRAKLRKK